MSVRTVIAHISDLHFGNHRQDVVDLLSADLMNDPVPDFLVVTGDLSQGSLTRGLKELKQAKDYLRELIHKLKVRGHEARYIVIPGNHDVGILKWQTSWKQAFEEWGYGEAEGNLRPASLYDYYFEKAGDRSEAGRMATNATRYCEYYPQCELAFLKFDSNVLAGRLWNYAHGRVGWQQISEMKKAIVDYDTRFHNFKDSRKVALVHHHIHYLPGDGSDRLLLMTDAGPFWRAMIDMGVELILHGHKHYMTHAVIRYMMPIDETSTEGRELLILSAGTATSRDLPSGQRYSYYKIACDSFRYRIQQYFRSDVAFGPEGPPIIFRKIPRFSVPDTDPPVHSDTLESILVPDEDDFDAFHYPKIAYEGTIGEDLSYTAKVTFEGTRTNQPFLTVPLVILDASSSSRRLA